MSAGEWALFIMFNIVINILFQVLAWKLAKYITTKESEKNARKR